jgi:hypothetical protein
MLNDTYQDTASKVLVKTLLPLRWCTTLAEVPQCLPPVESEALRHPFAVTTVVHLELVPVDPWPAAAEASALLHAVLGSPLVAGRTVQDGVPLAALPALPTTAFGGAPAWFEDAGHFVVLSGLHSDKDPRALASSLACMFYDDPNPEAARSLRSSRGAICVTGNAVGLVLPGDLPRAEQRMRCLHHNLVTLLGYVQNLATLTPAKPMASSEWFQRRAATVLNHLYRRAPLPDTNKIYKSRLPELWIDERQLAPFINALRPDLPQLPVRP